MANEGLNNKGLYRTLVRVALPIALQSLIGSSLNFIDSLMVGSLGEGELASVGIAVQIYFIFWMILYGFSSGSASFMAQFWGAGDLKNIRKTIGFTACVCMSIGMIFFVSALLFSENIVGIFTDNEKTIELGESYVRMGAPCFLFLSITIPFESALRATQQTHIPFGVSIVAFLSNTFLNYILIFGNFGAPALGVSGAALATSFSRGIQMTLLLYFVFGKKNKIAGPISDFVKLTKEFCYRIAKNAVPTTINESMWGLGTSFYVIAYAHVGVTEFAAVQAANTIQNLFQMAAFSVGDAVLILVGQKLGERKPEEAYSLAKRLIKIGMLIGAVSGAIIIVLAKPILSLYNLTEKGETYAFYILIVYGLTMWLVLYNGITVTGVLRCGGDTKFAMAVDVCSVWLIGVPLAFIATGVLGLPIYFVVLTVKMEEVIKSFILAKRFTSKKWVKTIIKNI